MTSIEWLIEEMISKGFFKESVTLTNIDHLQYKSEEMHKQEIEISDEEIDNAVVKEYENVGDEKLFPNHTDKDIWMNGFYDGARWYREQLKQRQ